MAGRVLKGEAIESIPFETMDESFVTVNKTVADKFGISIDSYEADSNATIVE